MSRRTIVSAIAACALIGSTAVVGHAKDPVVASVWAAAPPAIDGAVQDWSDAAMQVYKAANLQYAVRNDGRNLYLLLVFNDREGLTTIENTGLTVYYTAGDKKKEDLGVHFVRKQMATDALIAEMEKRGEALPEDKKAELRQRPAYTVFSADPINKKNLPAPADPAAATEPPMFRYAPQGRTVAYELRIPLSRTNQPAGVGAEPGGAMKIGFEWGGMTPEMRAAMMARRAESSTQASQGATAMTVRDEGGDGGGGAGGDRPFQRSPKKFSFWVDLTLASGI